MERYIMHFNDKKWKITKKYTRSDIGTKKETHDLKCTFEVGEEYLKQLTHSTHKKYKHQYLQNLFYGAIYGVKMGEKLENISI